MRTSAIVSLLTACALLSPIGAQEPADEERLDPEQVHAARTLAETEPDEAPCARRVERYDAAIAYLDQIVQDRCGVERFRSRVDGLDDRIRALRDELERIDTSRAETITDEVDPAAAQRELVGARERLAFHRDAPRAVEQLSEERAANRKAVSKRLGALGPTIEALDDEFRDARDSDLALRIAHGSDIEGVQETLLEVARNHPEVHEVPAPDLLLINFDDDAIKVELRYLVDVGMGLSTKDALLTEIDRVFQERGIACAMPRMDVDLQNRSRTGTDGPDAG